MRPRALTWPYIRAFESTTCMNRVRIGRTFCSTSSITSFSVTESVKYRFKIFEQVFKRRSPKQLRCNQHREVFIGQIRFILSEEPLLDKVYGIISTSNSRMVAATAQRCRHLARDHPAGDHPRKDTTLQQALHRWSLRYPLTHPRTPVPRCLSCTCGVLPLAVPRLPGFPTPVLPPVHLLGCFPRCFEFRAVRGREPL